MPSLFFFYFAAARTNSGIFAVSELNFCMWLFPYFSLVNINTFLQANYMQAFVTYTIPTVKNTAVKVRRKPFCTFMINIILPKVWPPGGP